MALPFLKHRDEAAASAPVETITREHDEDFDSLEVAAEDLKQALEVGNVKAIAAALRAAFELLKDVEEPNV